jgi:hypothetical protein
VVFLFVLKRFEGQKKNDSGNRFSCHSGANGDERGAERRMQSQRTRRNLSFYDKK